MHYSLLDLLQNVLSSTRWSFVGIMTLLSLVLGTLWYSKVLFGPAYMRGMAMGKDKNPGMVKPMIYEIISRVLYFIGLWWIFVTRGRLDFSGALGIAILVWLVYVFSTQLSLIAWSTSRKYVLWIVAGNALVQTVIATRLFTYMIS